MAKTQAELRLLADRVKSLEGTPKNTKCPGALKKKKRVLRNAGM